ncbi:MAG: DUF202 domain-containing protein [Candidatus Micrarchaeota archaeon]
MEDISLRDRLAVERTKLSQERTYLSYIRTGISLLLGGVFFVGYFESGTLYAWIGLITIVIAIVFLVYGFYKHEKTKKLTRGILEFVKETD